MSIVLYTKILNRKTVLNIDNNKCFLSTMLMTAENSALPSQE